MRIAFFSTQTHDREYFDRLNSGFHSITYFDDPLNKETSILSKDFDAVCAFVNDNIDKATIERLYENGIKAIALRCAGFNNVDIKTAVEKNIAVVRVPAYSPEAVAEHAVALIMTLNRKTHKAYNRVRESNFSVEHLTGFNLYGKTMGVIGTGRIGEAFCHIMQGFGCSVLAYDIIENTGLKNTGVTYMPLNDVLKQSDIISLHCPLAPGTHYMINKDTIPLMKKGVMLINTSRGAVIHTQDVIDALKSGKIGYLGIDVYEQEENLFFRDLSESIIQDDTITRLMSFPNVLITAHQGFFTHEALEQITLITLQNLTDVEKGVELKNEVAMKNV